MNGVILTAGRVDSSLVPLFGEIPTGLVPINGKPILFFIIEHFLENHITDIFIGVGLQADYLERITRTYFSRKASLHFVKADANKGPGDTLLTVFKEIGKGAAVVNLADSYVKFTATDFCDVDTVLVSQDIESSERWCTAEIDPETRTISRFYDKEPHQAPKNVLVGIYYFSDVSSFEGLRPQTKRTQISDLLTFRTQSARVTAQETSTWLDFGHIDKYQSAKKEMLAARFFNSLEFDNLLGTVTKRSQDIAKFVEEIRWQLELPPKLKILFPRIVNYEIYSKHPFITMEYYSYQSVAEIWLFSSLEVRSLISLLNRLLRILKLFREVPAFVKPEAYVGMYQRKTDERIRLLISTNPTFAQILEEDEVTINGRTYKNWRKIRSEVMSHLSSLYSEEYNCLIHGDFCFSNILYDVNGGIIRLLDPRGSWGNGPGGDIRYDLAKLRHSVCGLYDFIVNDLFVVQNDGSSITYEIFSQPHHKTVGNEFDQAIAAQDYSLRQIKLIEGVLFLSMLPLHADSQSRQLVMYCRGIELLNESLDIDI
ncbi:MAG: sugar phosphate nucleotidyltransferase [Nitrospira sp.]|nr:sugar phosphate nucleotidyltransferase [Nitrospira sp.]